MPLALRKSGEWRDHFENLIRLLGDQITRLPIFESTITAASSWLFQGVRDLLDKACVWLEGVSILKTHSA